MVQATGEPSRLRRGATARPLCICFFARANYELVRRRAESIAERGHAVHLITLHEGQPKGVHVHVVRHRVPGPVRYLWALPQVRRIVQRIKPDIIDVHGVSAYGLWATVSLRRPTMVTVYGPDLSLDAPRSALLRSLMRRTLHHANLIYGSSTAIRDLARETLGIELPNEKVIARSWGIPCDEIDRDAAERRARARAQLGAGPHDAVVLHARHMTSFWRVGTIFDAIPGIVQNDPTTRFWFVYPQPDEEARRLIPEMQRRVDTLGIADNVRFIGPKKYYDYLTIAHGADVFLCIGRSDLLASTVLEAMYIGLVPVLARLPVYEEVVAHGKNGYFLDTVDPTAVSAAVGRVAHLPADHRASIARANRRLIASRYDSAQCTDWLLDRYAQLVDANSTGGDAK